MSRSTIHHQRRISPAEYQIAVNKLSFGRSLSTEQQVVTSEMEAAAIALHGMRAMSNAKVQQRIEDAVLASLEREWEVRDGLAHSHAQYWA